MPKSAQPEQDTQAENLDFEKAMAELEQLVEKMEAGDFNLEQSLKQFEQGVGLTRKCQQALQAAELKVKQLVDANNMSMTDFHLDDDQPAD